jgi:hypothetical protein
MWDDVKDLFKDYPYIDEFVAIRKYGEDDCKLPEFDCIASWCSLPYIFKTTTETIPSDVPYITVKDGFDDINGGIGIVWAGSTVHDHDHIRSCYLRDLKPLDGLKLYSLQKGSMQRVWNNTGPVDLMDGSDVKYTDLAPRINDFNDTAKIISKLDAVATVDTSVAHLAAAMGKPVYLALGKSNDFRWFDKGSSSPWYPTVQIFRQESSWLQVWEQVRQKL